MFLIILYCDSSVLNNLWSEDLGLSNLTPWKKRPNRYSITGSANSWLHSVDLNPNKSLLLVKTVQLIPATKLVQTFWRDWNWTVQLRNSGQDWWRLFSISLCSLKLNIMHWIGENYTTLSSLKDIVSLQFLLLYNENKVDFEFYNRELSFIIYFILSFFLFYSICYIYKRNEDTLKEQPNQKFCLLCQQS